ncbi:MAG: LacI family DNA-binding transcriptional regulator [Caldilineaceae bacterium]|nr:LacI family DNA-binding transcriptional regulator [Caldilineaceae bacterium]
MTLQDVADVAGVNRVTASVALGRSPRGGTRVSEATRRRVLEVAHNLSYTPNVLAQALHNRRTHIVGYYAGYETLNASHPFAAAILNGLQRSCRRHQQDLLLFGSFERDSDADIYAALLGGKIDGLVMLPTPLSPALDKLYTSPLPIVGIANAHPAIPCVVVDDADGSRQIAAHLVRRGHRRILYRTHRERRTSVQRRLEAFCAAAGDHAMTVAVSQTDDDHRLTEAEIEMLTAARDRRPTAVVCWMDLCAHAVIAQCEALGLQVPADVAVVGFDGVPPVLPPARTLTTVSAPWTEVAMAAVDHLLALLRGDKAPPETVLPVTLHVGDTA